MDVQMPDGTLIRNVPEGTTKAELQRKLGGNKPQFSERQQQIYRQHGLLPSKYSKEQEADMIPAIAGVAGALAVPGAGWGALAMQGLGAFGGATAGELGRQALVGEELDVPQAQKRGLVEGAATVVGGGILKALGAGASKLFSTKLTPDQMIAAKFAKEQKAPFPLLAAAPGSKAGMVQQGSRGMLAGDLRTHADATKVAQFLNRNVNGVATELAPGASPTAEAARKGQQYLRSVFEPGETQLRATFDDLAKAVGPESAIPRDNTMSVARTVMENLKGRGEVRNPLYTRLRNIFAKGVNRSPTQTIQEMNDFLRGVQDDSFVRGTKWAEEGKQVMDAVVKDLDNYGKNYGLNFADEYGKATTVRAEFRKLKEIPGLLQLSKELGTKGAKPGDLAWMETLFRKGNGKALAEIRKLNPDLYHELADSWLASNLNSFSKESTGVIGRQLDGTSLRSWFTGNKDFIKEAFGAPQYQALDNFSLYASYMQKASRMADQPALGPGEFLLRAGSEAAAAVKGTPIVLAGEPAAYVLAKGLSDPSSRLFKLFTEGFSPATRKAMLRIGEVSGQAIADVEDE